MNTRSVRSGRYTPKHHFNLGLRCLPPLAGSLERLGEIMWYEDVKDFLKTYAPGTVILTALAFVFFAILIWRLTSRIGGARDNESATNSNRLVAIIGALCGWIIGTAFAPFSDAEKEHFRQISGVISAFLSGYVVSKLDRFLEAKLFPVSEANRDSWARVGLFVAAFLLAATTVFVNRLYAFHEGSPESAVQQDAPQAAQALTPPPTP